MEEKIEKLIEARNNALSEENKVLNALLKETKERIINNSRILFDLVYNDLMCQANNPYQVCLQENLKFNKKELSTLFMDFLRGENEEELSTEEKEIASFRRNWVFNNLDKEGLYYVYYNLKNYIVYFDELETLITESGLDFVPFKCDAYVSCTIKYEMKDEHVLRLQ